VILRRKLRHLDRAEALLAGPRALGYVAYRRGLVARRLHRTAEARAHFERAIDLAASTGDRFGQRLSLAALDELRRNNGALDEAMARLGESLAICRALRLRNGEAYTQRAIGRVHIAAGRLAHATLGDARATTYRRQAAAIRRRAGLPDDPRGQLG
jgi:tetratricopeptide (TPR) repeat protein